jgi:hypothetical protein
MTTQTGSRRTKPLMDPKLWKVHRCPALRDSPVAAAFWLQLDALMSYGTYPTYTLPGMLSRKNLVVRGVVTGERVTGSLCTFTQTHTCSVDSAGRFSCCNDALTSCSKVATQPCPHLCVLLTCLVIDGSLAPERALALLRATRRRKATTDRDVLAARRLQLLEAPIVDWRPSQMLPEDHYAL